MIRTSRFLACAAVLAAPLSCSTGSGGSRPIPVPTPSPATSRPTAPAPAPPPAAQPAAAAFSYDMAQAGRGEAVYKKVCVACHELSEYSGPDFRLKWNARPVFDLFDLLQKTMPDDNPGGLPKQDYADVSAYIMKLNGVRPGMLVLSTNPDELKQIKIDIPK